MRGCAKTLQDKDLKRLLRNVETGRHHLRDQVIILLSFKAGLRACEIAGLDWSMVVTAGGAVGDSIAIGAGIAKNGRARIVPQHPQLRSALVALNDQSGKARAGPVIRSQRGGNFSPGSVVNWFTTLYTMAGLQGCSSHSGRRTFITRSARMVAKVGGCLRDVQELAGHSALTTTERYIEGDRDAQRKLVRLL